MAPRFDDLPDNPPALHLDRPTAARMYDYYLGGKDNFAVDREAGDRVIRAEPETRRIALENRAFLRRAVAYLARLGIGQFLDLGSGLPTQENTHQVAQAEDPEARVVYVDIDPIVLNHGRALLANGGSTSIVTADLRDPETVFAQARGLLDLSEPVGLLFVAVLHFVEEPAEVVRAYLDRIPSGSAVVISHVTCDDTPSEKVAQVTAAYANATSKIYLRSIPEILALFDGLDLEKPGLGRVQDWRPSLDTSTADQRTLRVMGGLGWKR
jgi:hypothetical protein